MTLTSDHLSRLLEVFLWRSIRHQINMYIGFSTYTHKYTIDTPQVCSSKNRQLPMRPYFSSTNKSAQCQHMIIKNLKKPWYKATLLFKLRQILLVWICHGGTVISIGPVYTLGMTGPRQDCGWPLRADVGRGNYLDTVAREWECWESNTIWTWIWSTLLHAGELAE